MPLDVEFPHPRIRDPRKVKGKGRPQGSSLYSTSTDITDIYRLQASTDGFGHPRGTHMYEGYCKCSSCAFLVEIDVIADIGGPVAKRWRQH